MTHASTRCRRLISFIVVIAAEKSAIVDERAIACFTLRTSACAISAAFFERHASKIVHEKPTRLTKKYEYTCHIPQMSLRYLFKEFFHRPILAAGGNIVIPLDDLRRLSVPVRLMSPSLTVHR